MADAHPNFAWALAFDDVLLVPQASNVAPRDAHVATALTASLTLPAPFLAAAMDTVTEARLATALARGGGLGVMHKNQPIAAQAAEVAAVKRADPNVPAAAAVAAGPCLDSDGRLRVGAAVGVDASSAERSAALIAAGVDLLVVDTAHGHSAAVLKAVAELRRAHPKQALMAGNVATAAGTVALLEAGADVIKVGIGPGSICTTRGVSGVGVPQLSATLACAAAATARGARIVADGGVRSSGDAVKALAAGAAAVMVGGLFAGTDEAPGETVTVEGRSCRAYRGMGSLAAMRAGSADRYGQAAWAGTPHKLVAEGVEAWVPSRGPVGDVLYQLVGGLRAGMGYLGAADLKALVERAHFVRITPAGVAESRVHDVSLAPLSAPSSRSS